ncbi:MAG: glycoside hydrolase family 3 N-terminal domain-containing protein [Brumimicrobium sp.]
MRYRLFVVFGSILLSGLVSWTPFNESDKFSSQERDLPFFLRNASEWALKKMDSLTLEEKIAQSFMVEVTPNKGEKHLLMIDSLVETFKIGGVIMFQGDRANTTQTISRLQKISDLPLLVGMDAEWGSAMRLWNEKKYPFQLTMGAADDVESTKVIAQAIGHELREMGIHINFSPVVDVNTNPDNPVIGFRSFGESPALVAKHSRAMILGMESYNVLTCMKHFPGHGDTDIDSHKALPTVNKSKKELKLFDWAPYRMGRLSGASAVMMAHLNVPALDSSGTPTSLSRTVIQDILKGELKFSGLVISDALNMKAVTNLYGKTEVVKKAYLAGNDILLYPEDVGAAIQLIKESIENGELSMEEVNDKCLKILRAKYHTHLIEKEFKPIDQELLDYSETKIYENALTVIKNENAIPVKGAQGTNLTLNIGVKAGGFEDRVNSYASTDEVHAYSANEAVKRYSDLWTNYDNIFVNLLTPSVLPGNDFHYPEGWRELLGTFPKEVNVIVTLFGNPYVVKERLEFDNVDGVILAFENSQIAQERTAQLIFGGFQSKSKLPITLSADYPEGFFAETPKASRLKYTVPLDVGVRSESLSRIDSIAENGIAEMAYPGCQIVVAKDGKVFYQRSFGHQTYDSLLPIVNETIYDIASITKIVASTISLMKLQDEKKFSLDDRLGEYLPELTKGTDYYTVLLRDMMAHQARLSPWIPFYTQTLVEGIPSSLIYNNKYSDSMQSQVANDLFILDNYEKTIYERILKTPIRGYKKYKYSDLGYYFVKKIIENKSESELEDFVMDNFYAPMGLKTMGYHPLDRFDVKQIAPTEMDTYFRHQLVHGYVHDMGAAMLDGVGGHAGVFTNAHDLAALMQMLLNNGVYGGERYLSDAVVKEYTSCQFCPKNRRGAGFDKPVPTLDGGPTCDLVSLSSYGHSGFTGTQTWADPEHGINYVFISNRVYPDSENWKLVKMNIRTEIQKAIYELFTEVK